MEVKLIINDQNFLVDLEDNETTRKMRKLFPLSLEMEDLHRNEKYTYLSRSLPTEPQKVGYIEKGDLLLFGSDCLVIFYKSFDTQYLYTRVGKIRDPDSLDFLQNNRISKIQLKEEI